MLYTYTCPSCGWTGDRICRIAEADSQHCENLVTTEAEAIKPCGEQRSCNATLQREEIPLTSRMINQWSRWSGHTD
jgi:hypothetical protein